MEENEKPRAGAGALARRTPPGMNPGLVLLVVATLWVGGCTTTIYPPQAVHQPARVAVVDHGRHTSLVVEVPGEAAMVRYAYGDWAWFALRQTGAAEAAAAVLGRTPAALGRKRLPGPLAPQNLSARLRVELEEALYLDVEADDARRLVARLDAIFEANRAGRIDNAAYDLEFVPHPDDYSVFRNSNQMVGRWLEALGCRLDGTALFASWELAAGR